jgi:hypothetical protein
MFVIKKAACKSRRPTERQSHSQSVENAPESGFDFYRATILPYPTEYAHEPAEALREYVKIISTGALEK